MREIPGDAAGFRVLFETHRDAVHRFLSRLTRHAHDADDLTQETFLQLWRKRAQFRGEGSVGGYLRQIAYRTYLNARPRIERDRKRASIDGADAPTVEDDAKAVAARLDDEALVERVRRVVEALPEGWREAFVLFRFEGLTCTEVADAMGLTPKAVERRLTRALKAVTRGMHVRSVAPLASPLTSPLTSQFDSQRPAR